MSALAKDRNTPEREGQRYSAAVKAATKIFAGSLVCLNAGYAVPGSTALGLIALGRAEEQVDNTDGANGDLSVSVNHGVFRFENSASTDAITIAEIGSDCFVVDDQTVAKTDGAGTRSLAGRIMGVDAQGVWVAIGPRDAAGKRKLYLPFEFEQTELLAGTSFFVVSPVAGDVDGLAVVVQSAVTTGGTVTAKIATVAIDGLTCTVADAAPAGTVITDTPTAGHATRAIAAGGAIEIVPDAAFATAGAISGHVELTIG